MYCLPGNAGTNLIAENVNLDIYDFEKLGKFVDENQIDLVIVGPEKPLVEGVVDFLKKRKLKYLVQTKFLHNLKVLKYLQKI